MRRVATCVRRWCVPCLSYLVVVVLFEHVLFVHRTQLIMNEKLQLDPQRLTQRSFQGILSNSSGNTSANASPRVNESAKAVQIGVIVKPLVNLTTTQEKEPKVALPHPPPAPVKKIIPKKPPSPPNDPEQEKAFYRTQPTKVNPYQHDIIVKPKNLCSNKTYMLIIVHSFHPYKDRREAIRKTWGMLGRGGSWPRETISPDHIRLAFIFGLHNESAYNDAVRKEAEDYNDIIMGNFMDAYVNMTLKSLLGLKYFSQHCNTAKVLLKSDDDMIINLPRLLAIIKQKNMAWSVMGPINRRSKPYRTGKWELTVEQFPFHYFPPYESGSAYVITGDIISALFETSEYVPSIFIDDVYITGILGKILKINHVSQSGFAYWLDRAPTVCDITQNRKISGTKMTPESLMKLWEGIVSNVTKCTAPAKVARRTNVKPKKT